MSKLIATRGEIYAHICENSLTGLARNLFWNVSVEMEPLNLAGEEWEPVFACEWIIWPARTVSELDGMGLNTAQRPGMIESTIYVGDVHHWVHVEMLMITRSQVAGFLFEARLNVDLNVDGERLRETAKISCDMAFDGIVVVPDNLDPKPTTPQAAAAVVAPFFSLDGLHAPEFEAFRYILREKSP